MQGAEHEKHVAEAKLEHEKREAEKEAREAEAQIEHKNMTLRQNLSMKS